MEFDPLLSSLAGLVLGIAFTYAMFRRSGAVDAARRAELVAAAEREAERIRRDGELRATDEELRRREEAERFAERARAEWQQQEARLTRREASIEKREEAIFAREHELEEIEQRLTEREEELKTVESDAAAQQKEARRELLTIAGLTREDARAQVLARLDDELKEEAAARVQRMCERVDEESEERARRVLATAIQRLAIGYVNDSVTATVPLPSEEMKGRIIGREGRNIRAIEQETGVDVVIDDTPGVVVVSCFDGVRREVARRALTKLVADGRIQPARIEEVVAETRREIEEDIRQTAKKVLAELEVPRVDPRMQFCLGRLKYRTSYGQNQLEHAVEVAYLAAAIAGEIGVNVKLAKRCALFHDLGKALDHELEGGHPAVGAELARRCGELPEVVNTIAAHHGDVPAESVYAVIAEIADAVSAGRPGARRDAMERYLERLEKLESIARSVPGVSGAFAIQAGREVRVVVDAARVDDAEALLKARDIARRIRRELDSAGEVKVTLIREKRVTEYAR